MGTSLATVIGLLSLATPYASANPIRTSMPKIAGLVDSSRLAGGVTTEGQIVNGSTPVPSASIVAYAWPANERLSAAAIDSSFSLIPVAQAVSDSNGHYDLRVPTSDALRDVANEDGSINISVVATANGFSEFREQVIERGSRSSAPTAGPINYVSPAGDPSPTIIDMGQIDLTNLPGEPTTMINCQIPGKVIKLADIEPEWVIVGQSFSATAYTKANFTHISGASSELGVAFSLNGKAGASGNWKASLGVTRSVASTVTTQFPTKTGKGKFLYKTQFKSAKFEIKCSDSGGLPNNQVPAMRYEVRPTTQFGGANVNATTTNSNAKTCTPYIKGTTFIEDKATAITWSNGFEISSPILSIALTARTGYSSKAVLSYYAVKDIDICGVNSGPAEHISPFVAARPKSS